MENAYLPISEKCVHDLFREQAQKNPERIAVKFNEESLTYLELDKRSNQLAAMLCMKKTSSHPKIGISIERSVNLIVAVLAVLKSGGVCVPLDASYPENRLKFMVIDSEITLLLSTEEDVVRDPYLKNYEHMLVNIHSIDDKATDDQATQNSSPFSQTSSLDDLIYILYTSGSTGQPKGVVMPHRAITNLVQWQINDLKQEKTSNILQFSPISFDVAFQEIFSTLCAGHTLVLISEEVRKNSQSLVEYLKKESIARLFLPTVALHQLANVVKEQARLEELTTVIVAGEPLQITSNIELMFKKNPQACLYNHYGPTETHVVSSYKLSNANKKWPKVPPIGHPISNVSIYILDKNQKEVEPGESGELYIGGECLAKGYHNHPNLTKEKFIVSPFEEKKLLYRTGDLVCKQLDGSLHFLGRIDRQVKIRGFRVELVEIEVELTRVAGIKECVVLDFEIDVGHKVLIAYIVLDDEYKTKFNISKESDLKHDRAPRDLSVELQRSLSLVLPEHMIPSVFTVIHKIPLTPNGKVDRSLLPTSPQLALNTLIDLLKKSKKSLQEKITYAWEALLQIHPISRDDNFFDLGGHSLLLVALHRVLSESLGYAFPLMILFKKPTIELQLDYFNKKDSNGTDRKTVRKPVLKSSVQEQRKNIRKQAQARNQKEWA